jgi:DNA replication protein DnaC
MSDDLLGQVEALLRKLGLNDAADRLADLLPADPTRRAIVLDAILPILQHEVARRLERRVQRRIDEARFPDLPTLETFDFAFQPGLDKTLVMDLARLAWVERKEDLVLIGQTGVGKSHIAKALCLLACRRGEWRVRYTTCAALLADLYASLADGTLATRLKVYTKPELLLVDDLGYDPLEQEEAREAQLLYKVLEARHEKVSTIVTSNLPAEEWAEYLGNHYLTAALMDRILYHGTAITIEGPSYRLAQHNKRKAGRKIQRKGARRISAGTGSVVRLVGQVRVGTSVVRGPLRAWTRPRTPAPRLCRERPRLR